VVDISSRLCRQLLDVVRLRETLLNEENLPTASLLGCAIVFSLLAFLLLVVTTDHTPKPTLPSTGTCRDNTVHI